MRFLFITYYFPPVKTIASVRHFNVCAELLKKHRVWVMTSSNRSRFQKDQFPALTVEENKALWTLDFRTLVPNKTVRAGAGKKGRPSLLYRLLWSFPFNILLGIGGPLYIFHGYLAGVRLVRRNQITHLYSSFFPYADHVIACLLKKRFPHLKWVADFRDLHFDPVGHAIIWPGFQRWCNRKILKTADVLTTVSEGLAIRLKELHPNVLVMRNGIGELQKAMTEKEKVSEDRFIINYTGSLIPKLQNPTPLMAAINAIRSGKEDIRNTIYLQYAGLHESLWMEAVATHNLDKIAINRGWVSLEESTILQQRAGINLLLSYSLGESKGILTGKLFEYLNAGRPILLIIHGGQDEEFEKLFSETGAGLIVYDTDPGAIQKIMKFVLLHHDKWIKGQSAEFQYTGMPESLQMKVQVGKLLAFLSKTESSEE